MLTISFIFKYTLRYYFYRVYYFLNLKKRVSITGTQKIGDGKDKSDKKQDFNFSPVMDK